MTHPVMMNLFPFLLLLGLSVCSNVVELSYDDYYQAVQNNEAVLLEFYAPWCGHCKQLTPKYEEVASKLKGRALVAKVDATEDVELAEEYEVSGYPTIYLFKGSVKNPIKYEGDRETDAMVTFVERNLGKVFTTLKTLDEVNAFTKGDDVYVVARATAGDFKKKLTKWAEELRINFSFGIVTGDVEGFPEANSLRVFSPETRDVAIADRPTTTTLPKNYVAFIEWVQDASFPIATINANDAAFDRAARQGTPLFMAVGAPDDEGLGKAVQAVAEANKGKGIRFMSRDGTNPAVKEHLSSLGYTGGDSLPAWCIVVGAKDKKFCSDGKADADKLEEQIGDFVTKFLNNKLKKMLKSEDPENGKTEKGLTTVIGSSFARDITNNKDKDIMIEFYAPWCGHCKSLAPEYEELASRLESSKTTMVAKFDATANEWKDKKKFDVSGFPTIFFIKARENRDSKPTVMPYQGARTADAMFDFIMENARHPVELGASSIAHPDAAEES